MHTQTLAAITWFPSQTKTGLCRYKAHCMFDTDWYIVLVCNYSITASCTVYPKVLLFSVSYTDVFQCSEPEL